jgi:hypothetical protein
VSALVIGITSAVIFANQDQGLSGWDQLGIVVAGTLIASAFLGLAAWLWRQYRLPNIVVECGTGERFQQPKPREDRHRMPGRDAAVTGAYVTRLRVRETRNVHAPDVRIRVVATYPVPDDQGALPATLPWVSGDVSHDLPPRDRAYVRLCELVEYAYGNEPGRVDSHVPGLDRGALVEFQVEPVVAGKRGKRKWFVCEWREDDQWPMVREARF